VSDLWNGFVSNSSLPQTRCQHYCTVDEEIFPTKVRCWCTQYMVNKLDKFGIKSWLAVDVEKKYVLNVLLYLEKDEPRRSFLSLADTVVLQLMKTYLWKGRNVTTNNVFTCFKLARQLKNKKTSVLPQQIKQGKSFRHLIK